MDDLQKIHAALSAQRLLLQHLFTRFYEADLERERRESAAFLREAESASIKTEQLTSLPVDQVRVAVIEHMNSFFSDVEIYVESRQTSVD